MKLPVWTEGVAPKKGENQIVEFQLKYFERIVLIPKEVSTDLTERKRFAESSLDRVLIFKKENGTIDTRIINYIPDINYFKKQNYNISKNKITSLDKEYTGWIIIKNWQEEILKAWYIVNGKIKSPMKIKKTPILRSARIEECGWATQVFEITQYNCAGTISGDVVTWDFCEELYTYEEITYKYVCDSNNYLQTCDDPNTFTNECYDEFVGDGTIYVSTPVVTVFDVTYQVNDPCITSVLNLITDPNLRSQIAKLYNQTYVGNGNTVNVVFKPFSILSSSLPTRSYPDPTTNTWNIELNTGILPGASKEFVASVIVHELIHSFILQNQSALGLPSTNYSDHLDMFLNWTNQIRDFLVEIFPQLSANEATGLALGGIDDVLKGIVSPTDPDGFNDWFNQKAIETYQMSLTTANNIQQLHFNNISGTACN